MPPRLVFYGDDFTGSTDALEVLAFAGLRVLLFVQPPGPATLARYPGLHAIGVAGDSRGMSGPEMDAAMPGLLRALRGLGAPLVHYKVCSTFDSSPEIGSIGRVIAQARAAFPDRAVPIVGGTPALGRYCLFGNLFARSATDGEVHRIDRHPVMSVHPVTPMREGDLARHIAAQAPLRIATLTLPALEAGPDGARAELRRLLAGEPDAVLIDSATAAHQALVGELLNEEADRARPLFVVGGSGVEYALIARWTAEGSLPAPPDFAGFAPVDQLLAISGSASRVSAAQIDAALTAGFIDVPVDARALLRDGGGAAEDLVVHATRLLGEGQSVLLHTAKGPDDPRIAALREVAADQDSGRALGLAMGRVLAAVQAQVGLTRLAVAGGDTSSQAVQVLGIDALEVAARLSPGVPLCRIHAAGRPLDGVEITLKGGQMGGERFYETVRAGRA